MKWFFFKIKKFINFKSIYYYYYFYNLPYLFIYLFFMIFQNFRESTRKQLSFLEEI